MCDGSGRKSDKYLFDIDYVWDNLEEYIRFAWLKSTIVKDPHRFEGVEGVDGWFETHRMKFGGFCVFGYDIIGQRKCYG